jgi:hypothetical protein
MVELYSLDDVGQGYDKLKAAQDGKREPVRVIEGNFCAMDGVCPWWDEVKGQV